MASKAGLPWYSFRGTFPPTRGGSGSRSAAFSSRTLIRNVLFLSVLSISYFTLPLERAQAGVVIASTPCWGMAIDSLAICGPVPATAICLELDGLNFIASTAWIGRNCSVSPVINEVAGGAILGTGGLFFMGQAFVMSNWAELEMFLYEYTCEGVRVEVLHQNNDLACINAPTWPFLPFGSCVDPSSCILPICDSGFFSDNCSCSCQPGPSPIIIDLSGDGFDLTDAAAGANFDINCNARAERIGWTKPDPDDAFLVFDRNGNGVIDNGTELFGNYTPQPPTANRNGFLALALLDSPARGGNEDKVIDDMDLFFSKLRLWQDKNHNGVSEAHELHPLPDLGVDAIALDYKKSKRTDQYGNQFAYRAKVYGARGQRLGRWAWDVFFVRAGAE